MWCELEDAIKDEVTALEEDITPVPAVILYNTMRPRFDPEIEREQCDTANPANGVSLAKKQLFHDKDVPHNMDSERKSYRDPEARKSKHAIRQ